jgi:hypothetical protein
LIWESNLAFQMLTPFLFRRPVIRILTESFFQPLILYKWP